MARRRIGQERLGVIETKAATALDQVATLIDWADIDRQLGDIYVAAKGEHGWPPLTLFRAMLLAVWHDLSDVKLAEALADRASFRRFCGFASSEPTPERTAFVRFRAELTQRGLDRVLFDAITQQLVAKGVAVRTGTLVDATLIASASIRGDGEARWAGHRRRKPLHGYKAHAATDEAAGLILGVEVTSANVHDAAELDAVLPAAPGDVYGDSAFGGSRAEAIIAARGGRARIVQAGTWGGPAALARLQEHNAEVSRVRGRIEKVFGTCKAQLRHAPHALARRGEGRAASQADGDRLQPASQLATVAAIVGMTRSESAPSAALYEQNPQFPLRFLRNQRKTSSNQCPTRNRAQVS